MKPFCKVALIATFITTLCAAFPMGAQADDWNKKTFITTNQPLEIPGRIVLPAGTYTLRLADSTNRHIVQFLSGDESKVYNTVFTVPDYRRTPAPRTELSLYEAEPGQAHAVREWINEGSMLGYEFMYPKTRARELAMITPQSGQFTDLDDESSYSGTPVAAASEPAASAPASEPQPMLEPESSPSEDQAQANEPPAPPEQQASEAPKTEEPAKELPKTSGVQGLLLLIGMGSAVGGLAIRRLRH